MASFTSEDEKSGIKRKKLQNFIQELYRKNYKQVGFGSLRYLEQQTLHSAPRDSSYKLKTLQKSYELIEELKKKHASSNRKYIICDLPKKPWASHESYNKEEKFTQNHFKTESEKDESAIRAKKNGSLLKKITNRMKYKKCRKELSVKPQYHIIKSKSGNVYCKKNFKTEKIYDLIKDRHLKIVNSNFKFSKESKSFISKSFPKIEFSRDVSKRLYTIPPNKYSDQILTNKYKKLWEYDEYLFKSEQIEGN